MKKMNLSLIMVLALILAGCGPAMSLFPLYRDSDIVVEDSLVGQWTLQGVKEESTKDSSEEKLCCWTIESGDGGSYSMSYPLPYEGGSILRVTIRVLNLDGKLFVDWVNQSKKIDSEKDKNTDVALPNVPWHEFGRIWIERDQITVKLLDEDWLQKAIKKKQVHLDHTNRTGFSLTANTDDLQHFAVQFSENTDAFKIGIHFVRKL